MRNFKDAVKGERVARLLTAIQRDYSTIPKMINKVQSFRYTILEAYKDVIEEDFMPNSAGIMLHLKKNYLRKGHYNPSLYGQLQNCQPTSAAVDCPSVC